MLLRVVGSGSSGNSYVLISGNGESLILDCGCPYREILKAIDFKISAVSGVLISHEHT